MALIKCMECGKEISDKAESCPNCGAPNNYNQQSQPSQPPAATQPQPQSQMQSENKGKQKDSTLSIIAAACALFTITVLIGFILAIIDLATAKNSKVKERHRGSYFALVWFALCIIMVMFPTNKKEDATTAQNSDTNIVQSDTKSNEKAEETEIKKDKYSVGDTWNNEYVLVSYDECGEYISDNQFIQPADGNKYIYAKFSFENIGTSDTTVGSWDFNCYADGYACEGTYAAEDAAFSQTLSAGRKISGSIYFEVPKDAEEIEFEYSPSFWTSEKIVFVYAE